MLLRLCIVLALSTFASAARADVIFTLASFNGAVATTSFNVGDTVTMKLIATGSDVGPNNWAAFNTVVTATTATPNSAAVASTPMFNFALSNTLDFNAPSAGRTIAGLAFPTVASAPGDILGTFSFTASAPGPITFGFNNSNLINNTADFGGTPFNTSNGLSLVGTTITAVPEPSCLALVGFVGVGLAGYRRRRLAAA